MANVRLKSVEHNNYYLGPTKVRKSDHKIASWIKNRQHGQTYDHVDSRKQANDEIYRNLYD
jgi:hypothetical protein